MARKATHPATSSLASSQYLRPHLVVFVVAVPRRMDTKMSRLEFGSSAGIACGEGPLQPFWPTTHGSEVSELSHRVVGSVMVRKKWATRLKCIKSLNFTGGPHSESAQVLHSDNSIQDLVVFYGIREAVCVTGVPPSCTGNLHTSERDS